jgi:hypothetical protein
MRQRAPIRPMAADAAPERGLGESLDIRGGLAHSVTMLAQQKKWPMEAWRPTNSA